MKPRRSILCGALVAALTLPSCMHDGYRGELDADGKPQTESHRAPSGVRIEIINETTVTMVPSLHMGEHTQGRVGVVMLTDGDAFPLKRGKRSIASVRRPIRFIGQRKPDEHYVLRLRTEAVTPSWDERYVFWFEILGPPPRRIVLRDKTGEGGSGLSIVALADDVPIEEVPVQFWPPEDMP